MSLQLTPSSHNDTNVSTFDTSHNEFGVHDTLRHGTRSLKAEVLPGHPLENRLQEWDQTRWELKLNLARQTYGLHAPIKMMMEHDLVSKRTRMPVLPSSNLHTDILLGKDETIDFEDFLNTPDMCTDMLDVHTAMEHKLNMKI
ncbi:proteasome maturation factor UMP1 [Hesseltinella vesiculosa]|uniref:Proteasome maturation factor UMP1 n=1 Tax=Hesseltinella vesiculosa TaxID=101127 RepID=A0A1X2GPP4_9FUNG|nr:proteasome maturation factor UMP1 [Hesseltinella vesiculosa]